MAPHTAGSRQAIIRVSTKEERGHMRRRNISSGAAWEPVVGYSRAVRVGDRVLVSGTAPVAEGGGVHAPGDAYAQARRCLEIIFRALEEAGASAADVVRTRMFVTDIPRWQEYGRAHGDVFGEIRPATTMVEVRGLIDPDMLIEIEAEAVVARE
jgi:enamine deaminase RidA (YjgF/YER057c/UK114 family)